MSFDIHHLHLRKRIHHLLEEYPHPNNFRALLDKTVLILAAMWPLANLQQAIHVHITQEVAGLNLYSWLAYVFFTIPWIIYGFLHDEKLIQFSYIANFVLYLSIVVGIFIY